MLKPLVEPSLESSFAAEKNAFERNLLPGFAQWFVERVERCHPDFIVPAETKGARLLEATYEYAAKVLGNPIDVPILYRAALAYVDPKVLRNSKVMILDDAVRTGESLDRHREGVEDWGVELVQESICIGFDGSGGQDGGRAENCYRLVESPELYREYVWQLTEMVCARGLPPEVDHEVLEMRLTRPLALAWPAVEAALGQFGALSVDAPESEWGMVRGLTLHFPELPGSAEYPTEGPVRNTGPSKVRLFPDEAGEVVYVVPVSFPTLDLPASATSEGLSAQDTLALLRQWTGRQESVGELLAGAAHKHDPESVFRMLSASAETDLICGLARVIAALFPHEPVSIEPQHGLFEKLYGAELGPRVARRVHDEVELAMRHGRETPPEPSATEGAIPLFLAPLVVSRTREVAEGLQSLYEKRRQEPDYGRGERVGQTLAEIAEAFEGDRLLASRCVDFGLAMTTLVPYIGARSCADGGIRLERKYRVSEANRGYPFEDIAAVYQEMAEEIVTYCSYYLREHSERFADRDLPLNIATGLVAIMRPMLEKMKLPVSVAPGQPEPVIVLRPRPQELGPHQVQSSLFSLEGDDDEIVPSPRFAERSDADRLRIDRWGVTESVENFLDLMMPVLDGIPGEELDAVLAAWAMSSDRMLGLTQIQSAIEVGQRLVEEPLKRILRGRPHRASTGLLDEVADLCEWTREDLDVLAGEWASTAEDCWPNHSKRVVRLLESGAPPADVGPLFELPRAIIDTLETTSVLVHRLDEISERAWDDRETQEDPASVAEIGAACGELRRALCSLDGDEERNATSLDEAPDSIAAVVEDLLALSGTLGAFAAAFAGSFRGPQGLREETTGEAERETTILFMDLAGSFVHAIQHSPQENRAWKRLALGCAAQWGKAFGGREPRNREGDAIWLEFDDVGAAVLCGAAIQVHAHALRSTGVAQLQWSMRMAIDYGLISDEDGGNAVGFALDCPAVLAKKLKDEASVERVLVTPNAATRCSAAIRKEPLMEPFGQEVRLAEVDSEGASIEPWSVDSAATLGEASRHLRDSAAAVAERFSAGEPQMLEETDLEQGGAELGEEAG